MPGPAPSRNPRRRNARPDWRRLPKSGRQGEPPDWPLPRRTKAEADLWAQIWTTPQAVAWEELGWVRSVARYVRCAVQGEKRDASTSLLAEVRQFEDRLGLNPMSMRRLLWEVENDAPAETDAEVIDLSDYA